MWVSGISGRGASSLISSGAEVKYRHECVLSQVGTYPDMTLDVAMP